MNDVEVEVNGRWYTAIDYDHLRGMVSYLDDGNNIYPAKGSLKTVSALHVNVRSKLTLNSMPPTPPDAYEHVPMAQQLFARYREVRYQVLAVSYRVGTYNRELATALLLAPISGQSLLTVSVNELVFEPPTATPTTFYSTPLKP